ncbi:MAG: hypothetical protein AAGB51_10660 [Planctomycetota bacterium]
MEGEAQSVVFGVYSAEAVIGRLAVGQFGRVLHLGVDLAQEVVEWLSASWYRGRSERNYGGHEESERATLGPVAFWNGSAQEPCGGQLGRL